MCVSLMSTYKESVSFLYDSSVFKIRFHGLSVFTVEEPELDFKIEL